MVIMVGGFHALLHGGKSHASTRLQHSQDFVSNSLLAIVSNANAERSTFAEVFCRLNTSAESAVYQPCDSQNKLAISSDNDITNSIPKLSFT